MTHEERDGVTRIAEPAAAELLHNLVGKLTDALHEGGPVYALEFCSTDAIPLTLGVQAGAGEGLELKRTSFRIRNPANRPDEAEEAALLFFEEALLDYGRAPSNYVQRFSVEEYRYYRPLFVGEPCLSCHGNPDSMESGVRQVLSRRYPEDLATGYEAGDFRGVVRVSVPAGLVLNGTRGVP